MTNIFEDYEVLGILGGDASSACYKMKNAKTWRIEVWKAVNCEALSTEERQDLIGRIRRRASMSHPSLLKFYDCVLCEDKNTLYVVTDYCKFGNLQNLIRRRVERNEYVSEDFVWQILYRTALSLKNLPDDQERGGISTSNIYLDDDFNVKYYNFDVKHDTTKVPFNIGQFLQELCATHGEAIVSDHYTQSLIYLCSYLLQCDLKRSVDVILHHPTALQKVSQDLAETSLFSPKTVKRDENEVVSRVRIENIRNRELAVKAREDKLKEKERRLLKREKTVALLERMSKQKMVQAELYLRRSRRGAPVAVNYDKFDSSFSADCGESIVVSTSRKLDDLPKFPQLSRSCSERRVKFKGHSPLKDIHNTLARCNGSKSQSTLHAESADDCLKMEPEKMRKRKFSLGSVFSRKSRPASELKLDEGVRPISWSDENKRNAFALLRMMNGGEVFDCAEALKQTSL